jgi:hypothetical protein
VTHGDGDGLDDATNAIEAGRGVELGSVNTRLIAENSAQAQDKGVAARPVAGAKRRRPVVDLVGIVVSPVGRRGQFRAEVAGRIIVESSKQPFLDGARVLISEGYAPDIILEMWHANATAFALRSTVGAAAKLTVQDDGAPRFRRWKPFLPRQGSLPVSERGLAASPTHPGTSASPRPSQRLSPEVRPPRKRR